MKSLIVDVREPYEYALGHVEGAINIPLSKITEEASLIMQAPKDSKIILYCNSGNRSGSAIKMLKQKGYTNLINGINKQQTTLRYL